MGSTTSVTASFGLVAAAHALKKLAGQDRSPACNEGRTG
jgi:tRNA A37 threonylcarbamoyladenosine dehydratase